MLALQRAVEFEYRWNVGLHRGGGAVGIIAREARENFSDHAHF